MSVKTVIANVAANKKTVIKRSLIVVGTVVGIALTAGLIAKKNANGEILEPVFDLVEEVTAN